MSEEVDCRETVGVCRTQVCRLSRVKYTGIEAQALFHNKMIVMIGDSVMRSAYKDLVAFIKLERLTQAFEMRKKGEFNFCGDKLIEGGNLGVMHNGKDYREVRQMQTPFIVIRFYFITRSYSAYLETVLADLTKEPRPDLVLMSSCVWDMTRYGPCGVNTYKDNLHSLCMALRLVLPPHCLFCWVTTLPVGEHVTGGVIQENVRFLGDTLRLDVLWANYWAMQIMNEFGHDVIDLHSLFRNKVDQRNHDGIHWSPEAHRIMLFHIIDHVRIAWKMPRDIAPYVRQLKEKAANKQKVPMNLPRV